MPTSPASVPNGPSRPEAVERADNTGERAKEATARPSMCNQGTVNGPFGTIDGVVGTIDGVVGTIGGVVGTVRGFRLVP
ncbi:hypothetical protein [Williamsia sp.]|uniref:hypothetical protein n=1 Tax=Williamsia sp. TaxID=1872085 RepID=UPI002F956C95